MAEKCCIAISGMSHISKVQEVRILELTMAMQDGDLMHFEPDATLFRGLKAAVLAKKEGTQVATIVPRSYNEREISLSSQNDDRQPSSR